MTAHIVDNDRRQLGETLNEIAPTYEHLSIATGYWDLPGFAVVADSLAKYKSIRLLIGQEPLAPRHATQLNIFHPEDTFPESDIRRSLESIDPRADLRELVMKIKGLIEGGRLEVRVYRRQFLHAKTYVFGTYDTPTAVGVIGSSNFTQAGLTSNIELDALEYDQRVVQHEPKPGGEFGHLSWFDDKWNDPETEEWTGGFSRVLTDSPVGDMTFSPYMMYMKTLYELYSDELVEDDFLDASANDALFEFQKRNARLLLRKLEKHGLAMLADSVGLGKTITAGAVIKHYIAEKAARRVYVIAPASLANQWRQDLAQVHGLVSGFEVLSMQDLNRIQRARDIDIYAGVDLFVIDEAHNLRNDASARHQELLDWFSDNPDSDVLLLTATPINNSLTDFVNQIQLAAKGRLESFPVVFSTSKKTEVIDFFEAVERLSREIKIAEKAGQTPDFPRVNRIMRQGLRHFLVRSTRSGIEKEFGQLTGADGVARSFPESVVEPAPYSFHHDLLESVIQIVDSQGDVLEGINLDEFSVKAMLDQTQRTRHPLDFAGDLAADEIAPSNAFEVIFKLILLLGFAPYKPESYDHRFYGKSNEEIRAFKLEPDQSFLLNSQLGVHNMLRVSLLKRLESSQAALRKSLTNYLSKLEAFDSYLQKGFIVRPGDLGELQAKYGDDMDAFVGDQEEMTSDSAAAALDPEKYATEALKNDVVRDRRLVKLIVELCDVLAGHDDKLAAFVELLQDASKRTGSKVLVFSYYADTIEYLRQNLPDLVSIPDFGGRSAFISGATKSQVEVIAQRFSPRSKGSRAGATTSEIDYLFSTDVLSEGQNLQDCGTLVNFDLHWNPVRMIQRNGRINRLGSEFSTVRIHNMHPEDNLEEYLNLVKRLNQKIERIRHTVGTDQSVLGEAANPIEFVDDIEDSVEKNESTLSLYDPASATEAFKELDDDVAFLSEDEFVFDLRAFDREASAEDRATLSRVPLGKWGYLPEKTRLANSDLNGIGLVQVSGRLGSEAVPFRTDIFVSADGTYQALDTIEALQMLKTSAAENEPIRDTISGDRIDFRRKAIAVAKLHAMNAPTYFKVTPSVTRVLNVMQSLAPEIDMWSALQRIDTKQDKKKARRLIDAALRQIRGTQSIQAATVADISDFVRATMSTPVVQRELDQFEGLLFYAVK